MADLAALEERNKQLDLEQRDAERKAAEILKQQEATLKALGATRLEEETPPSPKLTTKKASVITANANRFKNTHGPRSVMSPRVQRAASASRRNKERTSSAAKMASDTATSSIASHHNVAAAHQVRILKAEKRTLEENLRARRTQDKLALEENKKLQTKYDELLENFNKSKRKENTAKKDLRSSEALVQRLRGKNKELEAQVSLLRREKRDNQKNSNLEGKQNPDSVRLHRALEENKKLKDRLTHQAATKQLNQDDLKEALKNESKKVAMLKRQRSELLAAFKKQLKLIDVLKRQKMHIEAAQLLKFTEDEYLRTIEFGSS